MSNIFVGRQSELDRLRGVHNKKLAALVVIKGRRRVGKSRLVSEFARLYPKYVFWSFAGLAPQDGIGAQEQRDHFAHQLSLKLNMPSVTFADWSDAFEYLSFYVKPGDIILFDEISWMGAKDTTFVPKLKAWWDKQTKHQVLLFCGSVSTWIEENILQSTAFFGRINLTITLEPLSIPESAYLLKSMGLKASDYDTYKLLSILGGIPWYLQQLNPSISVDQNIKQLAFEKDGLLVLEFKRIFNDLFNGKGTTYKSILESLKDGAKTLAQVRDAIQFSHSGTLSAMMEHLIVAGFVQRQPLWSIKTAQSLKQSLYRISDPYMRFYLKMIEPNLSKIIVNGFQDISLSTLHGFDAHVGLQLEYLLLQNRPLLLKSMGILPVDIIADGSYRQFATTRQKGCQIDYLVQTITKTLFVGEFKFRLHELGTQVINHMEQKVAALKAPRGCAVVPVLFHISGVAPAVATSSCFYRIIDIASFLEYKNS